MKTKKLSLLSEKGALNWARKFQAEIRRQYDADGELLAPMCRALSMKDRKTGRPIKEPQVFTIPPFPGQSKDDMAHGMRVVCELTNAVGMAFAVESWSVFGMEQEDSQTWIGRLGEHPDATEVVLLTFEHRAIGGTIFLAKIARDILGRPTLGKFEQLKDFTKTEGRFVNLLSDREGAVLS